MVIGIVTHSDCKMHDMGAGHPEQPARLESVLPEIENKYDLDILEASLVSRDHLIQTHKKEYVDYIFDSSPKAGSVHLDPDTRMNPFSLSAARRAAGAVISATDQIMSGKRKKVFCAVRPPGHHAEREKAMGFCLFNNIAVGAVHAAKEYKLKRIAVFDFDVHHGNGTEDILGNREGFLYCSTFQHPFYPYVDLNKKFNNVVRIPLPEGSGSPEFRQAVKREALPALDRYQPEIIFISAGFDAHREDPLGGLCLEDDDFRWVTEEVCKIAAKYSKNRVISALEGGYNLSALPGSVMAHLEGLKG